MKRSVTIVVMLIVLAGAISVDAATTVNLPARAAWTTEYVDEFPEANVGAYVDIAHHPNNGRMYVSYYDWATGDLKLAHQVPLGTGNCGAQNGWECEVIDSTGDVGRYSSIDVVYVPNITVPALSYTKIGIAYYDATNGALRHAQWRSNTLTGWTTQEVDDSGIAGVTMGTYASLKFDPGKDPVIAYHAQSAILNPYGAVKIASYVGNSQGNCGDDANWQCDFVDSVANVPAWGTHVSMDIPADATPQIAFYGGTALWIVDYYGFGGDCSNDEWDCTIVDTVGDVGEYASLHAKQSPTDKTQIAYYDATRGKIKYAISTSGGNCTSPAYNCYAVDTVGNPIGAFDLSMTVDAQGYPIIAYMNAAEDLGPTTLDIARPAAAYGLPVGNCGDVPPGMLFMAWQCSTVDRGSAYADEAEYVAVSVSPNGLAAIAYSEYNTYDEERYLKVAQQIHMTYLPLVLRQD